MNQSPVNDAFTQSVIERIDPNVYATFTAEQIEAIANAIYVSRPRRKHTINIRGFIPLYFARFYFVFLLGRDRRRESIPVEPDRRLPPARY